MVVQARIVALLLSLLVLVTMGASCAGPADTRIPVPPQPTEEPPLTPQITPTPSPAPTPDVAGRITKSGTITYDETWSGEVYIRCSFMDEADGKWFTLDETDWAHVTKK